MYKNKKISLCMPCRNEASHILEEIKAVPDYIDEIILISNCSSDNISEVISTHTHRSKSSFVDLLLDHLSSEQIKKLSPIAQKSLNLTNKNTRVKLIYDNRTLDGIGYGFAYITGIQAATGDYIVLADSDGTYPVEQVHEMMNYMEKNDYDFITGNRYPVPEGVEIPFKLQLGVNILNIETSLLYGVRIQDILSGMMMFKKTAIHPLGIQTGKMSGDWNFSPHIKINAATSKDIKYGEFQIYQKQRLGETKQNYWKTGFSHLSWIFLHRFGLAKQNRMDAKNIRSLIEVDQKFWKELPVLKEQKV